MDLLSETKYYMKKYNITANKSYGQNFLIDELALEKIIEVSNITNNDLIIEIGPGLGNLTNLLLKEAGKVICIELDKKMIQILNDRFSLYNNFEIINDDILKVDLKELISINNYSKVKVVANLPYYITTPIIMKLLESNLSLDSITIMVQKEVAKRLTEQPGSGKEIGAITYTINYYTNPKYVYDVTKECFLPSPKVDSSIINLEVLPTPKIKVLDEELFFRIIKSAFMQKRKTLLNSLSNSNIASKDFLEKMLDDLKMDKKIRAEKIKLEEFGLISDYISKK